MKTIKRLPSGDFILLACAHQYGQAPISTGNLFFFVTRLTASGTLETYDGADGQWKVSGLTYSGPNPAYGISATHRKENVTTPGSGVNTGIWTAVVPGGQFADGTRYFVRFSGWPNTAFYQTFELELVS